MVADPVQQQTGLRKAAAFLAVLSEEERELILQKFSDAEAGALRRQIPLLGPIPAEVVRALRMEFLDSFSSLEKKESSIDSVSLRYIPESEEVKKTATPTPEGEEETVPGIPREKSRSFIRSGLHPVQTIKEETSPLQIRRDSEHGSEPTPHFFKERKVAPQKVSVKTNTESAPKPMALASPQSLAERLGAERQQTIAMILSHLSEEVRSQVLIYFPERVQKEIRQRIQSLGIVDPIVEETVRQTLFSDFFPAPPRA